MNSVDVEVLSWMEILNRIRKEDNSGVTSDEQKAEIAKRYVNLIMPKLLSFLNDKTNIIETVSDPILPKVWAKEEEIFGSTSNHCPIMVYTSGGSMMYDAFLSEISNLLDPLAKHVIDADNNKLKVHDGSGLFDLIRARLMLGEERKLVLGQYDLLGVSKVNKEEIRVCRPNIVDASNRYNEDFQKFFDHVVIHEEIHNWQATHYPLNEVRSTMLLIYDKDGLEDAMTVIEGHAEFFTTLFSKDLVPGLDTARRKLGRLKKLKYKILGLDKLLARYEDGERFIKVLYECGGSKLANMPLEVIPTRKEIEMPGQYIDRVEGGESNDTLERISTSSRRFSDVGTHKA